MTADARVLAQALCGETVSALTPVAGGGGNNRLWRVETPTATYALKLYPKQAADQRDRLGVEFDGLTFLHRHHVAHIPAPVACDRDAHAAVYSWCDGAHPRDHTRDGIDRFLAFWQEMIVVSADPRARDLPPASAHTHSAAMVVDQVAARSRRLEDAAGDHPALRAFLDGDWAREREMREEDARTLYAEHGLPFDDRLSHDVLFLSPSDFGFHNALQTDDGGLTFLDFEYFGWDDPTKAVCDFALHAGMKLPADLKAYVLTRALPLFGPREKDDIFALRLRALYPLFSLLWCMITLNEFLPERWERRVLAGKEVDRENAMARQLNEAGQLLQRTKKGHDLDIERLLDR